MDLPGFSRCRGELAGDDAGQVWLSRLDFALLRAELMLAAVDGEISEDELSLFRSAASRFRDNVGGLTAESLWDSALHAAGYLLLQARLLPKDGIVAAFVKEASGDLVRELAGASEEARGNVRDALEKMASVDGDCSEVERACIQALMLRVLEERDAARLQRFPRGQIDDFRMI